MWDVDFGPQGAYFVTASHDRTARLWSCERIHPLRIFAGHLSDVECVRFHPNSNYILTGSADRSLRLWDVQRGKCVRVFTAGHPTTAANILSVAVSPDGQTAASGADDGSIVVWDLGSGGVIKRYGRAATGVSGGVSVSNDGSVYSLEFSADGSVLAAGTADGFVSFWETKRTGIASGTADKRHQSGGPSMDDGVYGKK